MIMNIGGSRIELKNLSEKLVPADMTDKALLEEIKIIDRIMSENKDILNISDKKRQNQLNPLIIQVPHGIFLMRQDNKMTVYYYLFYI